MAYIKSYSNYVLKKKHQNTNGGTVFERDITTIGGRNSFSPDKVPLYQSGNFVITVNNDDTITKAYKSNKWYKNQNAEIWTLKSLKDVSQEAEDTEYSIVLKKDYYNLRDFAYFGSCSELIRASISDILNKFPGELYLPYDSTNISAYTYETTVYDASGTPSTSLVTEYTDDYDSIPEDAKEIVETDKVVGGLSVFYTDTTEFNGGSSEAIDLDDEDESLVKIKRLGGETKFLLDNPFSINIHMTEIENVKNELRYFANQGYKNYELIDIDGNSFDFEYEVNYFVNVKGNIYKMVYTNPQKNNADFIVDDEVIFNSDIIFSNGDTFCKFNEEISEIKNFFCKGEEFAEITITNTEENDSFTIEAWVGDENKVYYLIDQEKNKNLFITGEFMYRIRPKTNKFNEFFENLDSFERILVNPDSEPKYTATFNVIDENEYGYYNVLKSYTFPTTYGGYNLGSDGSGYDNYIAELAEIAEFYDERFCDNIYRSLTHESIKNFDWTYYRRDDDEEVKQSADKIAKVLRVFGREFDEILSYINNISNYNVITYDNVNNLPDYFFSDALDTDGWDLKRVIPYTLTEFYDDGVEKVQISDENSTNTTAEDEKNNTYEDGQLIRNFTQDDTLKVEPYSPVLDVFEKGYFFGCICNPKGIEDHKDFDITGDTFTFDSVGGFSSTTVESKGIELENGEVLSGVSRFGYFSADTEGNVIKEDTYIDCSDTLRDRIKNYSSEAKYNMSKVNNEFMKRLIINSDYIWRSKGTEEGIEMILGMFGMKSKRWYDALPEYERFTYLGNFSNCEGVKPYDFEITEYTSFAKRIEDKYVTSLNDYKYNWINRTKAIDYGTDEYVDYQGLPVSFREKNGVRYLYPKFQKDTTYDGNFYYQMSGGWLNTSPFMFDDDDNIILKKDTDLFNETLKNVKRVSNLQELFEIPNQALTEGEIYYVNNLNGKFAVVDGKVYDILSESDGESFYEYFEVKVEETGLSIGNAFFDDYVILSNPYNEDTKKKRFDLSDGIYADDYLKVYLIEDEENSSKTIYAYSDTDSVSTFTIFEDGKYMEGDNFTHYFRLNDVASSNELSVLGWEQLKSDDNDFMKVNIDRDYYNGNNPHTGHLHYDNGHEYFTYFSNLFKYADKNNLFNEDILIDYPNYSDSLMDDISDFGFKGLISNNSCEIDYEEFLTEDCKVHYFGDWFDKNGNEHTYSEDENMDYDSDYNLSTINPSILGINITSNGINSYGWVTKPCSDNNVIDGIIDGVTDQIVNNKILKIKFYLRAKSFYDKDGLEEVKYVQDVIIPFMTQLIPSSIILKTEFIYRGETIHNYTIKVMNDNKLSNGILVETFKSGKWEPVGYTDEGLISFKEEGGSDSYKVRINSGSTEPITSATLDISEDYINTDYTGKNIIINVMTSYMETKFNTVEGVCGADSCLEFSGTTTYPEDEEFEAKIIKDERGSLSIEKIDVTFEGGDLYLHLSENSSETDNLGMKIEVTYRGITKTIIIDQFADNSFVSYIVKADAKDGSVVTFIDLDGNVEAELSLENSLVEYTKRKITAQPMKVKISGGLNDSTVDYYLETPDGSDTEIVGNNGEENLHPTLNGWKMVSTPSWDNYIYASESEEYMISPNEMLEIPSFEILDKINYFENDIDVLEPSNKWIQKTGDGYSVKVSQNNTSGNRIGELTYYLKDNQETTLALKVLQTEGSYTFKFNDNATVVSPSSLDGKTALLELDYSKQTIKIPFTDIISYANDDPSNKIAFVLNLNNDAKKYIESSTMSSKDITLVVKKNYRTDDISFSLLFIQKNSNKRISLTIKQSMVSCQIGDVYCYNPSTMKYSYFDVLGENGGDAETIADGFQPIGVVAIPMDNKGPENPSYARIISLTEKINPGANSTLWIKAGENDMVFNQTGGIKNYKDEIKPYGALPSTEKAYAMQTYKNGMYFAKTYEDIETPSPMIKEGNNYIINPKFTSGTDNGLSDFTGKYRTYRAIDEIDNQDKHINNYFLDMIKNYSTPGTRQNSWYMGSLGEMSCVAMSVSKINRVLNKLSQFGYACTPIYTDDTPNDVTDISVKYGSSFSYGYWTSSYAGWSTEFRSWAISYGNNCILNLRHRSSKHNQDVFARIRPMLMVNSNNNNN